ncbi:MAG: septum formation initiator family protein [Candidatus Falkowbacteria bacterium]
MFPLIGLILVLLIGYPLVKKINQQIMLNREIEELSEEMERINNKNKKLEEIVGYLESASFVEKEARLNLDLRKPGEKVVVVKDKTSLDEENEIESVYMIEGLDKAVEQTEKINPQKWWSYFFNETI